MLMQRTSGSECLTSARFAGMNREAAPFAFLRAAETFGVRGALVTIYAINGGAPKPVGTQLGVLEDGRYIGYVSGGCVEPGIASEVAAVIARGRNEILTFGRGSRFIDIRFPCGGGIDVQIQVDPDPKLLGEALFRIEGRRPFSLVFDKGSGGLSLVDGMGPATGHAEGVFRRRYLPRTRVLLVGRGADLEVTARVARAAELDIALATPSEETAAGLADLGVPIKLLRTPSEPWDMPVDPWTATVLLFHEHEWEDAILANALGRSGFYVGALGSRRTHGQRRDRLAARGVAAGWIGRIRGPIGLIERAREPGVLALSILAEIAEARMAADASLG
jgi:xanthine dehydrogenase accessory factor